ncbi:hypothetical protein EUGRSUZ_L01856 [Eucalyptus grandis]|uniref:Transmembrane protein n=1 Tax=Eucalyptus grandis TaxID=71139 RepID=A0A058ZS47_EUCGR|nr:hypothetical protein EUGRSUZ_L01856 [Eucalyptus grandis]
MNGGGGGVGVRVRVSSPSSSPLKIEIGFEGAVFCFCALLWFGGGWVLKGGERNVETTERDDDAVSRGVCLGR